MEPLNIGLEATLPEGCFSIILAKTSEDEKNDNNKLKRSMFIGDDDDYDS
jgi:hypothetical protein